MQIHICITVSIYLPVRKRNPSSESSLISSSSFSGALSKTDLVDGGNVDEEPEEDLVLVHAPQQGLVILLLHSSENLHRLGPTPQKVKMAEVLGGLIL